MNTSRGTLTDLYRQRGYWRASFETPTTALEQGQACSGVSVTIPVQEGAPYATDRIAWSGNAIISSRELDALMPLKSGEMANMSKLDDGLRRVKTAYSKQGYIMLRATYMPQLNDDSKRAVFDVKIDEGPQFHFGTVTFPGLAPDGVAVLSGRWRLKSGDVFDATYVSQFFMDEIRPRLKPGAPNTSIQTQIDKDTHIVNVKISFGG